MPIFQALTKISDLSPGKVLDEQISLQGLRSPFLILSSFSILRMSLPSPIIYRQTFQYLRCTIKEVM